MMLCYLMAWRTLRSHFSKKLSLWTGFWSNIIIMRFKCYKLSSLITVFRRYSYLDFSQRYDNGDDPHSIYQDYPPYPDPFVSTFRSFSNGFDISKVMKKKLHSWLETFNNKTLDPGVASPDQWWIQHGWLHCLQLQLSEAGCLRNMEVWIWLT